MQSPRLTGLDAMLVSINITNLVNNYEWDIYLRADRQDMFVWVEDGFYLFSIGSINSWC